MGLTILVADVRLTCSMSFRLPILTSLCIIFWKLFTRTWSTLNRQNKATIMAMEWAEADRAITNGITIRTISNRMATMAINIIITMAMAVVWAEAARRH